MPDQRSLRTFYELDRGIGFISTSKIISLVVSKSVTETHNFTTSMHSRQDVMRNYKQVVHSEIGSSAATHFSSLVLYFTLILKRNISQSLNLLIAR